MEPSLIFKRLFDGGDERMAHEHAAHSADDLIPLVRVALADLFVNGTDRCRLIALPIHFGPISPVDLLKITSTYSLSMAHSAQVDSSASRNRSTWAAHNQGWLDP